MRFGHARRKDKSHCANSLPPTLRKKHAKDGAPTAWLDKGRLGHPPGPPAVPGISNTGPQILSPRKKHDESANDVA
jgi:hypothetical protein